MSISEFRKAVGFMSVLHNRSAYHPDGNLQVCVDKALEFEIEFAKFEKQRIEDQRLLKLEVFFFIYKVIL